MNYIQSNEISVVIQGPLYRNSKLSIGLAESVSSIRLWLPYSEIIVSTWDGESVDGIDDIDKVIFSQPPAPLLDINGNANYVGHQILSTKKGIVASTRKYVLKIRADHMLEGQSFLIEPLETKATEFTFLKRKIVVSSFFLRNPLKVPYLFHISDLVHFGLREDMLSFWNTEIPNYENLKQDTNQGHFDLFSNYSGGTIFREVPEQTLIIDWLKRNGINIRIPYPCATSYKWFRIWELILAENFYVVDARKSQILYPNRFYSAFLGEKTVVGEKEYSELLNNPGSYGRYILVLLNKYILALVNIRYWMSTANVIVSRFSPKTAKLIRSTLRRLLGITHPHRK